MASLLLSFYEATNIFYHAKAVLVNNEKYPYQYNFIPSQFRSKINLFREGSEYTFTEEDNLQVKAWGNCLWLKNTTGEMLSVHPLTFMSIKEQMRDL